MGAPNFGVGQVGDAGVGVPLGAKHVARLRAPGALRRVDAGEDLHRPGDRSADPPLSRTSPVCAVRTAALTATVAIQGDNVVIAISGELDLASKSAFTDAVHAAAATGAPVFVDCAGLSFIDAAGTGAVLRAVHEHAAALVNVPSHIGRVLDLVGAGDVGRHGRDAVALVMCESTAAPDARQLCKPFLDAGEGGGGYDIEVVTPWSTMESRRVRSRWCSVVVPPITRWMGMPDRPTSSWLADLAASADYIVGVGTGALLLACAGLLDGRDVIAAPLYAGYLQTHAPTARVHLGVGALIDGPVSTASSCVDGVAICSLIVGSRRARFQLRCG